MTIILTVIFVMCMFGWLMTCLPFPQVQPFAWAHPIMAWIAVAILGYVILSGEGARRLGALSVSVLFG
jgi:hypothetical protein